MSDNIIWFDSTVPQAKPQLSISKNGRLYFGRASKEVLPEYVQIGFDARTGKLLLKESVPQNGLHVNSVPKKHPPLTICLAQHQVLFPAIYCISPAANEDGFWEGTLIKNTEQYLIKEIQKLAAQDLFAARSCDAMETLLELYKKPLSLLCRSNARTIPKEDRLQIAKEGFLQAVLQYNANLHIFSDYVLAHTRKHLKLQAVQYSGTYQEYYPLERKSLYGRGTYEVHADQKADAAFEAVSGQYDLALLLNRTELQLYQLLEEGYQREEILERLALPAADYDTMLDRIRTALKTAKA